METKIENGHLSINLWDLLSSFKDEGRAELIDALACQTEVIDEVMNQVIDGWTTRGSHGSTGYGGEPKAMFGIDGARLRIAKASSDIAAREIERLAEALERSKAHQDDGWAKYHALCEERRARY